MTFHFKKLEIPKPYWFKSMAVSHPGNRDAAAQQRPHCSNGSVCMNRKTKKFYYLECKVKLIGMKKYR